MTIYNDYRLKEEISTVSGLVTSFTSLAGRMISGVQSARPGATTYSGTLYIPTDGYAPAISNGTSWDNYIIDIGFKCTDPPSAASFTKVGSDVGDTLVDDDDGLLLTMLGKASTNRYNSAFLVSLPAAPYTFVVGFDIIHLYNSGWFQIGICLSDGTSTSNKFLIHCLEAGNLGLGKLSALNTWSAAYPNWYTAAEAHRSIVFFKITDDTSNRYYYMSSNGRNWIKRYSVSRTDYATPTHGGLWLGSGNVSIASDIHCIQSRVFHWYLG